MQQSAATITFDASIEFGQEAVTNGGHDGGRRVKQDKESLSKMLGSVQSRANEDRTFLTTASGAMAGFSIQKVDIRPRQYLMGQCLLFHPWRIHYTHGHVVSTC